MGYGRKAWTIVAWAYDADIHCDTCTRKRFSDYALAESLATDSEGNPVHPVFSSDYEGGDVCGDCHIEIV